jgi:hypothetical protein
VKVIHISFKKSFHTMSKNMATTENM